MIPPRIIAEVVVTLVLLGLLGNQSIRLAREQAAHQTTIAEHAAARANAINQARVQEQAYAANIAKAVHAQAQRAVVAEADAVRASSAADRLRERAKAFARGLPDDSSAACRGETERLADALDRMAKDAGQLIARGNEAINRGLTCQSAYPVQ